MEKMGIWAIIVGFTSILSQSTAAVNTNIIREVAEADDENYQNKAAQLIINGLVIYIIFFILLSLVVLISLYFLFKENISNYIGLISLALVAIFINLLATVFSSVIDARKLNYVKNSFIGLANILFLIICFFSIKKYALIGVAIAQIAQAFILLTCVLYFVLIKLKLSFHLNGVSLKNIQLFFRDSWKLQGISLLVLCYEPITKFFLSEFGLTYVAKYEIANKIIAQLRNIFAVTNQTLLAYFVNKYAEGKKIFIEFYEKIAHENLQWSLIANGMLLIVSPIFSFLFLKEVDWGFILIFFILLGSNFINIISITSYFNFFAQNKYHTPFISHIIIALLNVILSLIFGHFFKGIGVVMAWSISLLFGSLFIIYKFNKGEGLKFKFKSLWNFNLCLTVISFIVLLGAFIFSISLQYFFVIVATIFFLYLYQAFKLYQLND